MMKILFVLCTFLVVVVVMVTYYGELNNTSRVQFPPPMADSEDLHSNNPLATFRLPVHEITNAQSVLSKKDWYKDLEAFLSRLPPEYVTVHLLTASYSYLALLLNWLSVYRVTTGSSLSEILVVSLSSTMHKTLIGKGFNSILIHRHEDIFVHNAKLTSPVLSPIWIKRITVARIINHLGYHVMMIDLDAVMLKDIAKLMWNKKYNSSDIISSMGSYPTNTRDKWGFTLCMGAVLIRSTPRTEIFWNAVSNIDKRIQDDQMRINYALQKLGMNWTYENKACARSTKCTAKGETISKHISVTLLSTNMICRRCDLKIIHDYYIWHDNHGVKHDSTWFLKDNWKTLFTASENLTMELLIDQVTKKTKHSQ